MNKRIGDKRRVHCLCLDCGGERPPVTVETARTHARRHARSAVMREGRAGGMLPVVVGAIADNDGSDSDPGPGVGMDVEMGSLSFFLSFALSLSFSCFQPTH
jgi:hypothetical protein